MPFAPSLATNGMKRFLTVCVLVFAAISMQAAKNVVVSAEVTRARVAVPRAAKTELVLCNIRFENHPGTQFHVVLERRDDRTKRVRVGTLNFYMAKGPVTRTFDVTDELRELAARGDVDVVLEATSGRSGANSKAMVDPKSKLTIGEIVLRAKK